MLGQLRQLAGSQSDEPVERQSGIIWILYAALSYSNFYLKSRTEMWALSFCVCVCVWAKLAPWQGNHNGNFFRKWKISAAESRVHRMWAVTLHTCQRGSLQSRPAPAPVQALLQAQEVSAKKCKRKTPKTVSPTAHKSSPHLRHPPPLALYAVNNKAHALRMRRTGWAHSCTSRRKQHWLMAASFANSPLRP